MITFSQSGVLPQNTKVWESVVSNCCYCYWRKRERERGNKDKRRDYKKGQSVRLTEISLHTPTQYMYTTPFKITYSLYSGQLTESGTQIASVSANSSLPSSQQNTDTKQHAYTVTRRQGKNLFYSTCSCQCSTASCHWAKQTQLRRWVSRQSCKWTRRE